MLDNNAKPRRLWLFSAPIDLAAFLGSALLALLALLVGHRFGLLEGNRSDSPQWTWVTAVLLIDVAHVWSTGFRVYFDRAEFQRRRLLYVTVPILSFLLGVTLYSESSTLFWRVLAYVAVFHFVRQQYGWVMLYRARVGERDALGKWIDVAAIYLSMLYPLLWWHANLPRRFWWFLPGDFVSLPTTLVAIVKPIYWASMIAYACRSLWAWLVTRRPNPGKDLVVVTTALCWHLGIVTFNSDYAFTVTNVIIHGIPYLVLIWWYRIQQRRSSDHERSGRAGQFLMIVSIAWMLAYVEELLWDRGVWHERSWLFGAPWEMEALHVVLVPLLAVPQLTHYLLDGFIWRRKTNPGVASAFSSTEMHRASFEA